MRLLLWILGLFRRRATECRHSGQWSTLGSVLDFRCVRCGRAWDLHLKVWFMEAERVKNEASLDRRLLAQGSQLAGGGSRLADSRALRRMVPVFSLRREEISGRTSKDV